MSVKHQTNFLKICPMENTVASLFYLNARTFLAAFATEVYSVVRVGFYFYERTKSCNRMCVSRA